MAVKKVLVYGSLIAFAIASQPAFAANSNDPPAANPSTTPAKQPRKHHAGKHRHQQEQAPPSNGNAN